MSSEEARSIDLRVVRRRIEIAAVWIAAAAACLFYALPKGQDVNWDQRNYHVYTVYALLHGRLDIDVMPSQLQTWTNPLGEVLQYLALRALSPVAASVLLSLVASVAVPLVYFIAEAALRREPLQHPALRPTIALLAATGAFAAPLFLSEIGTTLNDGLGATCVLGALLIAVRGEPSTRRDLGCGALLGLALAIKLTNASYLAGWAIAVVLAARPGAVRRLAWNALGAAIVYLPLGGLWHLYIFWRFGNPVFPLANDIFRSDAYLPVPMIDDRFQAKSLADALGYFPKWLLGAPSNAELVFRDARFSIVLALLVLALLRFIFLQRSPAETSPFSGRTSLFIAGFFVASFIVWMKVFGTARFAIVLEQLAPLLCIILLGWLCRSIRGFLVAATACLVVIVAVMRAPDWGHAPFGNAWIAADVPETLRHERILFVMLSGEPTSYVITELPSSDSFVRIEGNMPLDPGTGLGRLARARIADHDGEIRTLSPARVAEPQSADRLRAFGLVAREGECAEIATKVGLLKSCLLQRQ